MNKGKEKSNRIISLILSAFILVILIFSGPANAFVLNLTSDKTEVGKSEKITFTATLDLEGNDMNLPVKNLTLVLDGPVKKECVFDIEGKQISGCFNINIKKINVNENYGYGYGYYNGTGYGFGYGYGINQNLEYEITIHSQHFVPGTYKTSLLAAIGDKVFSKQGNDIKINAEKKNFQKQSYSGIEQEIDFNNTSTKLTIKTNSNVNGNVVVTEYDSLPQGISGFGLPFLSRFIEIDADSEIENNINETLIKVYYTDAEVSAAGIDENSLRLYYYNATSGVWQVYDTPNGGVDVVNNYVWAKTDHLSLWGLFGSSQTIPSGGGGGRDKEDKPKKLPPSEPLITLPETQPEQEPNEPVSLGEETKGGITGGITGAVTGVVGKVGILGVVVFLVTIAALSAIVYVIRKRSRYKI